MLVPFFFKLREVGVPVTLTEFLALLAALESRVAGYDAESFYFLARTALVKDERHYDRFDVAFAAHFQGAFERFEALMASIPEEWMQSEGARHFSDEEKARIEALGGWDKLLETLRERLKEQRERHEGGSRWIGTRGTSPFGADGYHPEGVRIGQAGGRHRSAVKVWERREYRNLDDDVELGTRNIKLALRRLRRFAREGAAEQLDIDDTIGATAKNAGLLDLKFVAERRNAVKVLLFLDIGGSMDAYVQACEELFSAARSEFRHLVHVYFHNCPYERIWKDNRRRRADYLSTVELMRTYGRDYRVVFVGDAAMSPYELLQPGGSIEHLHDEAGVVWLRRLVEAYPHTIWLNPERETYWDYTPSTGLIRDIFGGRMFPLTVKGIEEGMRALRQRAVVSPLS